MIGKRPTARSCLPVTMLRVAPATAQPISPGATTLNRARARSKWDQHALPSWQIEENLCPTFALALAHLSKSHLREYVDPLAPVCAR
jgi:hypothetical protein